MILHGLFGSARNWGVLSKRLADVREVIAADMRNHGGSDWSERHGYDDLAQDVADTIGTHVDVLGHSMGGKAAMVLALRHPETVRRLIVADIAPAAYGHTQQPFIDAMRAVDLEAVTARRDADAQMRQVVPEDGIRAFLLQSLDVPNRRWRLNLDALEAQMDRIMGWPRIDARFDGPALFLSGGASDYVTGAHRRTITDLFPRAQFRTIDGAGHWLHAERPREVEAEIRRFLED